MFNKERYNRSYYHSHKEYYTKKRAEERMKQKEWAFTIFDGKCVKCGFDDIRTLEIDHINGGGTKERTEIGHGPIYGRVLQHPEKYQLLCANCHKIKTHERKEIRRAA